GDPKYGPKKKTLDIEGQALHEAKLGFTHPRTGEELEFSAPIPEDMEHLLHYLRKKELTLALYSAIMKSIK
ncbi:hypothetical protein B4N84_22190, partial [Flavobacterium sp. IR1]